MCRLIRNKLLSLNSPFQSACISICRWTLNLWDAHLCQFGMTAAKLHNRTANFVTQNAISKFKTTIYRANPRLPFRTSARILWECASHDGVRLRNSQQLGTINSMSNTRTRTTDAGKRQHRRHTHPGHTHPSGHYTLTESQRRR